MKKLILTLAFLFIPSIAWAQCTGVFPANTICGNNTGIPSVPTAQPSSVFSGVSGPTSSFTGDIATWSNFSGSSLQDQGNGVFNVRLSYGAVPNGTTDNTAAIVSAFTAANTYITSANNIPTVYFDCGKITSCMYNFSGATSSGSLSAINPTIPMTIRCNAGVSLNYTGTGHAADIGASGLVLATTIGGRYTIEGCQWTGGANDTAGIYLQDHNIFVSILNNQFFNFGAVSTFSIVIPGNTWEPLVMNNQWLETNGIAGGVLDAHLATSSAPIFIGNQMECIIVTCTEANSGVGVWTAGGIIMGNTLQNHRPNIRIASAATGRMTIRDNHFEPNSPANTPLITYGDPNTAGANVGSGGTCNIDTNYFLNTGAVAGTPIIGPETASSGSHTLNSCRFENNFIANPLPTVPFFNTNGGVGNIVGFNLDGAGPITIASSPPIIDTGFAQNKAYYPAVAHPGASGNITAMANAVAAFDSNGIFLGPGTFHSVALPLVCANSTASNTQSCTIPPPFNGALGFSVPVAGDMILYNTTFQNTGAVTLNVNSSTAAPVKKNGGFSTLLAGDLQVGVTYPMTFDGTNWQMTANSKVTENMSLTFATLPTSIAGLQAYIVDGLAGNCGDGSCTTWGTSVNAGGGALPLLIWSNGTRWTLIGK